jgi:hypothetical protein
LKQQNQGCTKLVLSLAYQAIYNFAQSTHDHDIPNSHNQVVNSYIYFFLEHHANKEYLTSSCLKHHALVTAIDKTILIVVALTIRLKVSS